MARINHHDTFDYAFDPEDGTGGFNSWDDLEVIVDHVAKPLAPTMSESFQDVPARYGGVYTGTHYGERQFDIPITIMAEDRDDYNRKLRNLTNALINTTDDISTQYPLRFNDDPDVMYYGHFTAIPTPVFIYDGVQDSATTLTFMCADPRGFMATKSITVTDNDQIIVPEGNMTAKPIIHIIPKTDVYYLGYETNAEYVAIGYNTNAGNTITSADGTTESMSAHQRLQVDDPCNTMATWFQAGDSGQSIVPYRGDLDGKAGAHGNSIMVLKDSKGHYNWGTRGKHKDHFYGPAVIHNGLPKITPYWKVSVRLHHEKQTGNHNSRSMGKIEAYLLDNDGQIRGRMGIQDYDHGRMPVAYIQLGTSFKSGSGKYHTIFYNRGNPTQRTNLATTTVKIPFEKKAVKSTTKKKNTKAARSYMLTVQREAFRSAAKKSSKKKTTKKKATKKKVVKKKKGGKAAKKVSKPKSNTKLKVES